LIRQAEAILEQDPPLLPVAWERIHTLWYNYVKGVRPYDAFGIYDIVRVRVPVEGDHGFRWKMITQSGGT